MAAGPSTEANLRGLTLRYAAHLGYRSSEEPLFRHSAGSVEPVRQIDFAARRGFSGMQYALACNRPVAEQAVVAAALEAHRLRAGLVVYAPFDSIRSVTPGLPGEIHARTFLGLVERGLDVACRVGSTHMAVLAALAPDLSPEEQRRHFADRLQTAAALARAAGLQLVLEPLCSPALPPMLMTMLDHALELIEADPTSISLAFDTAHVQLAEGNAAREFERVYPHVSVLQLADVPGRTQPGSGEVDFQRILAHALARGFSSPVELEHGWTVAGAEIEEAGLVRIRQLERNAAALLQASS